MSCNICQDFLQNPENCYRLIFIKFNNFRIHHFFNSFKGAKESDINKIIGFKVKDYIAFPPEEAIIGYKEISKDTEGKAEVFSAVIERKIVKGSEELLYSRGISNFTCTTSSFPFLNFVETEAYALVTGFKDSTTIFFVSGGKLIYARKMKPDLKDEFVKTMAFYSNKYKETPVGTLYTVGNVNTDGIELPVKAIDPMQYVKTEKSLSLDKETAELILPAIGAAICI